MHLRDGHTQINEDGDGKAASKQAQDHENPAHEFDEGGDITQPCRDAKARDETTEVMQVTEYLVRAMANHHRAQDNAQYHQRQRLHAIEIAHSAS